MEPETDVLLKDPGDLDEQRIAAAFDGTDETFAGVDMASGPDQSVEVSADAATGDLVFTTVHGDEDPVHLARCAECGRSVKFRSNVTGTGFFLVDADPDASYGAGHHGRPICPDGHGEMEIADDQLKPVPEAFADAATMLQAAEAGSKPVQGDLPGILPAFNYQGCYLELEEKAAEVNVLHEEYLEAKEAASDAKKAWDRAAELYTKMALEFRRRRQAKGDDGPSVADPPSLVLACSWDKANPDDRCPLCSASSIADRDSVVRVLGAEILPRDANGHAEQVLTYRQKQDILATAVMLDGLVYDVSVETVAGWTTEEREMVRAWAAGETTWETIPAVLGRPHVAGQVAEGAKVQACTECGAVLRTFDDIAEALPACARVRTDCAGSEADGHRYPDTSKPKRQRKPREAAADAPTDPEAEPRAPKAKKPAAPTHKSFPKPSAGKKSGKGRR